MQIVVNELGKIDKIIVDQKNDATSIIVSETPSNDASVIYVATEGEPGATGLSAYQIAILNGFVGTEEEWLESLVPDLDVPISATNLEAITGQDVNKFITPASLKYVTDSLPVAYIHDQGIPSTLWTVTHNLNRYVLIQVINSAKEEVEGVYEQPSMQTAILKFNGAFSGTAILK